MFDFLDKIPKLPVGDWAKNITKWISDVLEGPFTFLQDDVGDFLKFELTDFLASIPAVLVILVVTILAFFVSGKRFGLPLFSLVGLLFIYNQGLWFELMQTFILVLLGSLISIILGVPLGILMAKSKRFESFMKPVLDFMQTMPAFVYLIPAVIFFGVGMVPGIFASLIFATPPTIRLTNLGIRQVSKELIEASESFGSTSFQKLFKVELPMAKTTIMAGINQTVMLSLSMVVIASMIGAPGLGKEVQEALSRSQVGPGFVAGISIVILAIIMDRFTQSLNKQKGSH